MQHEQTGVSAEGLPDRARQTSLPQAGCAGSAGDVRHWHAPGARRSCSASKGWPPARSKSGCTVQPQLAGKESCPRQDPHTLRCQHGLHHEGPTGVQFWGSVLCMSVTSRFAKPTSETHSLLTSVQKAPGSQAARCGRHDLDHHTGFAALRLVHRGGPGQVQHVQLAALVLQRPGLRACGAAGWLATLYGGSMDDVVTGRACWPPAEQGGEWRALGI